MRNIFISNFSLSYQCYLASLVFSHFVIWFIIHRAVITFLLSGFFSLHRYLRVCVLSAINMNRGQRFGVHQPSSVWEHTMSKARQLAVRALSANNHYLAWEYSKTDLSWATFWEMGTTGNQVSHPLLSGSISFVRIQARSAREAVGRVGRVGWWQ